MIVKRTHLFSTILRVSINKKIMFKHCNGSNFTITFLFTLSSSKKTHTNTFIESRHILSHILYTKLNDDYDDDGFYDVEDEDDEVYNVRRTWVPTGCKLTKFHHCVAGLDDGQKKRMVRMILCEVSDQRTVTMMKDVTTNEGCV